MPARVFILIPAFNVGAYIKSTIESVLAQTYPDWELLILDDCSTDNTALIVEPFVTGDKRIKYLKNEHNIGMLRNWNKGISFCQSPYFVKLDGDDVWHPDMIQSALSILDSDEAVGIVFTQYVNMDSEDKIISGTESIPPDFAADKSFSCIPLVQQGASKMLSYNVLRQGLSLMRAKIFDELGHYKFLLTERTQASTDTEFYFRVGCHYKIYCINKVLYYYRVHQQSISARNLAAGLSELKMYEVKRVINDYYYTNKKIARELWKKNNDENEFKFLIFLNYQYRRQKLIIKFLSSMVRLIATYPYQTIHYYLGRLIGASGSRKLEPLSLLGM